MMKAITSIVTIIRELYRVQFYLDGQNIFCMDKCDKYMDELDKLLCC